MKKSYSIYIWTLVGIIIMLGLTLATTTITDTAFTIGTDGLTNLSGLAYINSTNFGIGTSAPSYLFHSKLGASDRFYIDGTTTNHTDTNGVLSVDLGTATANVKGIFVNSVLQKDDLDGVTGIYSSVTGYSGGHTSDREVFAYQAAMTGDNNDNGHSYTAFKINNFVSGGGTSTANGIYVGTGYNAAFEATSGDVFFYGYSPTISADRDETDGAGDNITIHAADAYGAGDQDGGSVFIYAGQQTNSGSQGNIVLGWDGAGTAGTLQLKANTTAITCNTANIGAIYYDGVANKHYGCNSTGWNAMY